MLHITQSYERDNFQDFLRNDFLTDNFTPCEEEIFFDFKNIKQGYKLGEDKTLDLDVFEFETISEFDPRVTLTREVAKLMKKYGACPNALVAFYNSNKNTWRLSLITTDYINENGKIKTEYSNPRRFSFVLGEHCKAHTPEQMLISKGQVQDVLDLHSRFDIEVVTKEFYNKLFEWYSFAIKKVTYPVGSTENISEIKQSNKNNELNLIRLITRLIFVWFIKQKNLVPDWIFDKNKIANILKNFSPEKGSNYYNAILQNLFFATLNKKIEDREFATDERRKYNSQFGVKNYFRDNQKESFFKISHDEVLKLFYAVPFLNGGLFECLDKLKDDKAKTKNIQEFTDGFSREPKWRAFVPNELFFSENSEHEGLIVLLNRYNFTVEENTPTDVQVALDPELLGKVFENLLGTYNPETSETARKDSGSFYTPREIVNYMVDESLKAVLSSKCRVDGEKCRVLSVECRDRNINSKSSKMKFNGEYDDSKRIQRINCVAKSDASGRECLYLSEKVTKRGNICNELPNQTSGNFDSVEYSGRTESQFDKRVCAISGNSARFESGTRNATGTLRKNGNATKIGNNTNDSRSCRNRQNAQCDDMEVESTNIVRNDKCSVDGEKLNTQHSTLNTKLDELFNDQCDNPFTLSESTQVANAIKSLKILDPAVGSGAFPMGVLLRMVHLLQKLGAISQNGLYDLKLSLLENCIFGVDIQPIAVQICKLRFFISIICEQEKSNDASKNYGIRPLPNLESKFVAANTLIGLAKEKEQVDLFGNEIAIDKIKTDLAKNRHKDFSAKTSEEKWKLREEYKELRQKLAGEYGSESAKQLNAWDPYDQNASSSWFSSEWMFNVKADCDNGRQKRAFSTGCGFDVVVGNPPYVLVSAEDKLKNYYKDNYQVANGGGKRNLFHLFYERGAKLLKKGGVLSLITPDTYLAGNDTKELRKFLTENFSIQSIVTYSEKDKVFENVTQAVAVCIMTKGLLFDDFKIISGKSAHIVKKADVTQERNFLFRWSDCVISKMNQTKTKFGDFCAGFQGDVNLTTKKAFFSDKKRKGDFPLVRGIQIAPYSWSGTSEYCSVNALSKERQHQNMERIVFQQVSNMGQKRRVKATMLKNVILGNSVNYIYSVNKNVSNYYILAILNSKAVNYYFKFFSQTNHITMVELNKIPIPLATAAEQKTLADLAQQILDAKAKDFSTTLGMTGDTSELEAQIDAIVYKLYGLTAEEIKIIENLL